MVLQPWGLGFRYEEGRNPFYQLRKEEEPDKDSEVYIEKVSDFRFVHGNKFPDFCDEAWEYFVVVFEGSGCSPNIPLESD